MYLPYMFSVTFLSAGTNSDLAIVVGLPVGVVLVSVLIAVLIVLIAGVLFIQKKRRKGIYIITLL